MLLGIHLSLMIGPEQPVPAPAAITEALVGVEATLADEGQSGFQLTFQAGRSGRPDLADYPLLLNPLLRPFNRVLLTVIFNATPRVLMDGFITRTQLTPSEDPGASTFVVTGEDVSVVMDLIDNKLPYPAMGERDIVDFVLLKYLPYLVKPATTVEPRSVQRPPPTESIPTQGGKTDLKYIQELARRCGHVFHVTPGPLPRQNSAYWGPPERIGVPQPALTAIHWSHRMFALVVVAVVGWTVFATRKALHGLAVSIGLLLVLQFSLGVANVAFSLPLALAAAHNAGAAALLAALVVLNFFAFRGLRPSG